MGREFEVGCFLFWGGRADSLSNAMSFGPRPISLPSGILIHPAIWPQQTWAKNWGCTAPMGAGELGPHLAQCGQGLDQDDTWYAGKPIPVCQVSS